MRKLLWLPAVFIGISFSQAAWAALPAGFWQYPAIAGVGPVHPLPNAGVQPSKIVVYKAVFNLTKAAKSPTDVNDGLAQVARAVNVFASAGVPPDRLRFVVIVHGPATSMVLDNMHYKQRFGMDNPNDVVIRELTAAGVQITVCGQSLADNQFEHDWVNSYVEVTLSAPSTLIVLQHEGYALVPL
jgi:DsrE/DsrF-like family.